jgi:hypothetical protein
MRTFRVVRVLAVIAVFLLALYGFAEAQAAEGQADEAEEPEVRQEHRRTRAEPRAKAERQRPGRTLRGDLNRGWFHLGGGFGATVIDMDDQLAMRSGRVVLGGGRYVPFFYGGGGVEITGHQAEPLKITAVGNLGLAIPIPVFHPLVGLRVGGGHHLSDGELLPHLTIGPQAGFILRQYDGKVGMRMMVDAGIDYRIEERETNSEIFVTLAVVF